MPSCRSSGPKGIHVLLSRTADGRLTLGDRHSYAMTRTPFQDESTNEAVLRCLSGFAALPSTAVTERWEGCCPSLRDGRTELVVTRSPG